MKLTKDDKEYIKSIETSTMSDDKKKYLIRMVKGNRIVVDAIMKQMDDCSLSEEGAKNE